MTRQLLKVREGGGFGFERRDGFDEAGDGERVAHTAGATDQAQHAPFAGELDGDAHQRGDSGAVNLGDSIQHNDDFLCPTLDHGFKGVVKLLGRLADGEPAANFEYRHSSGFADIDFHGQPVSHGSESIYPWYGSAKATCHAERHYTLEDKLHKVSYTKGTVPEVCGRIKRDRRNGRIRKTNRWNENFKLCCEARLRIILCVETAGPRKSNPEQAERT